MISNTVIIIIIVIIVVAIILFSTTNLGNKLFGEKFQALNEPTKEQEYSDIIMNAIDGMIKRIGGNVVISPQDQETFKNNMYVKAMDYWTASEGNEEKIRSEIKDLMMKWMSDELVGKYEIATEVVNDIYMNVISNVPTYLEYREKRFDAASIGPGEDGIIGPRVIAQRPVNTEMPIDYKYKKVGGKVVVKNQNNFINNSIMDEINKDHNRLTQKNNLYGGLNSANLVSGVRRHGFSSVTKGKIPYDVRGRPRSQVRRLASLSSSKDPNGLVRYSDGSVRDLLSTSKGFSNEQMWADQRDERFRRTRENEHRTFRNISDRMVRPGKTNEEKQHNIVIENIQKEILNPGLEM